MAKTVIGSFYSYDDAKRAIAELDAKGFPPEDMSLVANNVLGLHATKPGGPSSSTVAGDAVTGAVAGGVLGGAAAMAAGIVGLAIPGIGPVLAAGPLMAALGAAGAGAVAGGLVGALVGSGIPEEDAHDYAEAVRRGGALVTVRTDESRADEAAAILQRCGAVDIKPQAQQWRQQGWRGYDPNAKPYSADELARERQAWRTVQGSDVLRER